jgi:parallel beta-helix repeat protein
MRLRFSIFLLLPALLCGSDFFVAGTGNDKNHGDTPNSPFRTIQKALDLAHAGDVVNVMNGEYRNACGDCAIAEFKRSGTEQAWITLRAYPGHKPVLNFDSWKAILIKGGASYIEISGLEIHGDRADYTFEYCRAESAKNNQYCNGSGINIDGRDDGPHKPHHIRISGNHIWQCPGGGINAIQADYVTIEDNIIHENAWYSRYAMSGISIYQAWNADDKPGPKIIVRRNRVFNNRSLVDWMVTNKLSDGNGIIIDDLRNTQNQSKIGPYHGGVLVENNLAFNNGGGGITTYLSDGVQIINNTAYKNGQVVGYPDIFVNQSSSVKVFNNIAYSRPSANPIQVIGSEKVTVNYNLAFNGVATAGSTDPRFVAPSTEWALADFHLAFGSPAIGSANASVAPKDDLEKKKRGANGKISRGAYESKF